ncbi:hypothetical protein [Brevibacillus laterosporus]|uniref:hypothetical protein n=1 Tax=Brevibacillus laterosporus TaxID=1465 RepID=UPI00264C7489|nr:hypothetical protein [Brevibacillus laterosporus]MDN9012711.1 hypothetical protein [Brevibacillus laterosporus]MDO0943800.1 hypothetical protein [Brevibacillus laterosporus]
MNGENKHLDIVNWEPKISVRQVSNSINDVVETGKQIIKNTEEDLDYIFENVKECVQRCGVSIDNIRLRLTHRFIQYSSLVLGALCSNGLIPADIIKENYEKISDQLRRNPNAKILHLKNPKESVWPNEQGETADPVFDDIEPDSFVFEENREAWVFIHGMSYKALKKDGSDFSSSRQIDAFDYFANFEKEARVFNPDPNAPLPPDTSKIDIYLITYDSEMSDEEEEKIKVLLQSVVIGGGNYNLLIAAVFWKEMKRRAEKTAAYIKPFLEKLDRNTGRAITHSLGCYVLAYVAEQIISQNNDLQAFNSWWCMSPAIPSDSFSNTGSLQHAPLIAGSFDGLLYGTSVWYSLGDLVLMLLYPLAACTTALGLTGLGVNDNHWAEDYNITNITDVHHGPDGEYIQRLGSRIREALRTTV